MALFLKGGGQTPPKNPGCLKKRFLPQIVMCRVWLGKRGISMYNFVFTRISLFPSHLFNILPKSGGGGGGGVGGDS